MIWNDTNDYIIKLKILRECEKNEFSESIMIYFRKVLKRVMIIVDNIDGEAGTASDLIRLTCKDVKSIITGSEEERWTKDNIQVQHQRMDRSQYPGI